MPDITSYVDGSMYPAEPMVNLLPTVHVVSATDDPLGSIALVCRIYEGFPGSNRAAITDDMRLHYWEQMKNTVLNAPLEFVKVHLFIDGVTRAFTHQMVRQRTACYAQESLRFAVKDDLNGEVQLPPSIAVLPKNHDLRLTWSRAIADAQLWYHTLIENGIPAEDARGLLPHSVTTRLHYSTDLRNLMNEVAKRTCTQAQFEWRHYVTALRKALGGLHEEYPASEIIGDNWQWRLIAQDLVKPPCFAAGHCTFKASFDRPCTIRDRVEAGQFDQIDEIEYLANPRAAWDHGTPAD